MNKILIAAAILIVIFLLYIALPKKCGQESLTNMSSSSCDTSEKRKSCDACTSGNASASSGSDICYWKSGFPGQEGLCESGDLIGDDTNWSSGCKDPSPSPDPSPAPTETFNSCALIEDCSTCVSPDTYINRVGRGVCFWKESSYDYMNVFHPASCTSFEDDGTSKECSNLNPDDNKSGDDGKNSNSHKHPHGNHKRPHGGGHGHRNDDDEDQDSNDDSNKPGPGPGPGPYISRQKVLNCLGVDSDQ